VAVPDHDIRLVGDLPPKAHGLGGGAVAPALRAMLAGTKREALLISPYFIPGAAVAARLIAMVRAGIRVSVITNSLAATDVMAAHAGYSRYRRRLIAAGVELYELKHSSDRHASMFGSSAASLHTKAVVVDDGPVFIGSFNLDPRSANLNTEMGVMVNHAGLARLMRRQHAWLAAGERSWRLALHGGSLAWEDGVVSHSGSEPGATLTRRLLTPILSLLPIESLL
jgi:cardiolipin synthase C